MLIDSSVLSKLQLISTVNNLNYQKKNRNIGISKMKMKKKLKLLMKLLLKVMLMMKKRSSIEMINRAKQLMVISL